VGRPSQLQHKQISGSATPRSWITTQNEKPVPYVVC